MSCGQKHALVLIDELSFNKYRSATPAHLHVFLIVTHHGHCWASCRAFPGLLLRPPALYRGNAHYSCPILLLSSLLT